MRGWNHNKHQWDLFYNQVINQLKSKELAMSRLSFEQAGLQFEQSPMDWEEKKKES